MALIGIDIGTSFIKGAVLDLDGPGLGRVQRVPFPAALPGLPPLHREVDPRAVVAVVKQLLDSLLAGPERCEGLVMCSQMHGLVLTTAHGEPRSNLTTWQDQRVLEEHPDGRGAYFDALARRMSQRQVRQLGNELRPGQPVGVLFWLAEQGRLPDRDLFLASLPDFVIANLCRTTPYIEITHALSHGALDLETLGWHTEVLASLGLAGLRWPEIRPHGTVVGWLPINGHAVPCYTPVGDFQCAILGTLLHSGELSINVSTGSQVSLLRPTLEFGDFQTRPYFDGRFLATITHIPAGRSLNALVKLLTEMAVAQNVPIPDPWDYIADAVAAVDSPSMQVDLAFFNSSCGDHGAISNLREEEMTVGHIFRAAFANMADNYVRCPRRISPEQGWQRLVFSGGLCQRFPLLRTLIAARFDVNHRMSPTAEDALWGLLVLAQAFTGRTGSVEEAVGNAFRKIY